ncbi:MAG: GerMN domain-containing protein [Actinomycetales bacterium]|nr:GerMN domain-containing protein [Actinomycetales bacterium]
MSPFKKQSSLGKFRIIGLLTALPIFLFSCHTAIAPGPNGTETPSLSPAPSPSPSASPSASQSPSASPAQTLARRVVALYYVGKTEEGFRLYREFRSIPVGSDVGLSSLQFLTKAPSKALDGDYFNLWGNGSIINSVSYSGDKATVDLLVVPLNVGSESEARAIDQLVWTLTANHPSTKYVSFTSDGKQFESFAGHVDARQAFSRELAYEVLAPVWVNQVSQIMSNPVIMRGTACTFEAGLHWQLFRNGEMIREGSAVASGACPIRGAWSVELGTLRQGEYVFAAQDVSAKDGSITQEDTKEFSIK